MSSAKRGRERNQDDLYETPYWLTEAVMPTLRDRITTFEGRILDPCAGNGRITKVLERYFGDTHEIVSMDLNPRSFLTHCGDFLEADVSTLGRFDAIVFNPPFSLAERFIRKAFELSSTTGVVMSLERVNFFGSKSRSEWFKSYCPSIAASPRRASFLPTKQADSIEYGWFYWKSHGSFDSPYGRFHILPTTTCSDPGCEQPYEGRPCKHCDYVYCKEHFDDDSHNCGRNLYGTAFLWACENHPTRAMVAACKKKADKTTCGLPLCGECWETHRDAHV